MQSPLIPLPILTNVLPIHHIPLNRLKRNPTLILLVAVNKPTPPLIRRRVQNGEISPAARRALADTHVPEERAHALAAVARRAVRRVDEPVGMEVVVFARGIAHELDGLDVVGGRVEALEGGGAGFDTADDGVVEGDGGG